MLADLIAGAREDAERRRSERPLDAVEHIALARKNPLDVLLALAPSERVHIIAEVKRASPSRGELAQIPDPAALARDYEVGGASAVSVLTEERRFHGSLEDLEAVRASVSIPVLRKEFISDPYQIFEARAAGADFVLLIVAALEQKLLRELAELITQLGMTPLVEAHSGDELSRAFDIGARLVGINARNLSTFELDRDLFSTLADRYPPGTIRVAESAVKSADDVARYRNAGADVVLVGEALVTSEPASTLKEFLGV